MQRRLVVGNWKMNGTSADLAEIDRIEDGLRSDDLVRVAVCLPATLIVPAALRSHHLRIGGQDCHRLARGPHTGGVSGPMLKDAGANLVILGHSERRAELGEVSEEIAHKVAAAKDAGLVSLLCVGESAEVREGGGAIEVVVDQLASSLPEGIAAEELMVAYEPIWAIGSGRKPKTNEIASMHAALRRYLAVSLEDGGAVPLLYGGSVTVSDAEALMGIADVDGVLVGGASLRAADFLPIVDAARRAVSRRLEDS